MELRGCGHFHYIQTLKGGLVTKVINVNSRGKPAITFKKLADIYESLDVVAHKSLSALQLEDGREENIADRSEFKVESQQIVYAERKLVKVEPEVSDSDSGVVTDCENSDAEVDNMTLKMIMDGCKKRKLRQSESVDSRKKKLRICSRQLLNHSCLSLDEDDSDLNVTLSLWTSKLSKRKKSKTKCKEGKKSTTSLHCKLSGKSDTTSDQDLPPSSDVPFPVDVKLEVPETDVTEIQNTNYISEKFPVLCDENPNFCLTAEPVVADELVLDIGLTTSGEKIQHCVLNSACHEYWEGDESEPLQMVRESSTEDTNKDDLETQKSLISDFPLSETTEEQFAVTCVPTQGISEATIHGDEQVSDTDISRGKSFTHEVTSQNSGEILTHLHRITSVGSLQFTETSHGVDVCLTENERTVDHVTSTSPESTSDCNLNTDQLLISVDKYPDREKQSQISEYSDSERNSTPNSYPYDDMDEGNQFQDSKLQHRPTRLLSTRTTISPTSQERLSKAMEYMQLHDKECKPCDGKSYVKQTEVDTSEVCDQTKRVEFDINHEQNIRRSKKRSVHSRGTATVPHVDTRGTVVQTCSESVIAFTQRQMQDIECVALKLTNQLKSMKAIAEDRLHVEGNIATNFKFNLNEVRTAIADASKVEAHARKWLSIMSRDCNRFCKIMKTSENGSTGSNSVTHKIKKKITFADEAGGKLCQVRLIEDDVVSCAEPNLEKV